MKRHLFTLVTLLSVSLLLSACGRDETPNDFADTPQDFTFNIDPNAQTATLAVADSLGSASGSSLTCNNDAPQLLLPGRDLAVETFKATFSKGKLDLTVTFKNVSPYDLTQLSFQKGPSYNVLSSQEPTVTAEALGGDGKLSPGEVTKPLTFTVKHKGKFFIYTVLAKAVVTCDDGGGDNGGGDGGGDGDETCTDPVSIPDEGLDAALRDALGKPSGNLTCTDLERLEVFEPGDRRIANLQGLQFATNLQTLDLSSNPVRDISPLASLSKLRTLDLSTTQVNDISPLAKLAALEVLSLTDTVVFDLTPLAGLTNLKTLFLEITPISDLSPLVANDGLGDEDDEIYLGNTCLDLREGSEASQDIATLEARNPSEQNVIGTGVPSLPVGTIYCPTPEQLADEDLTFVNIPNFSIETHNNLENPIRRELDKSTGLLTLEDMARLVSLEAVGGGLGLPLLDLEGLQYAVNLEALDVSQNDIISLQPITGLERLKRLNLELSSVDITPLADLTSLEVLNLSSTLVSDLAPLAGLSNLTELNLADENTVSDLSPIANLTNLESLNLRANPVSDLGPLAGLEKLQTLLLDGASVAELGPLAGLSRLEVLGLSSNRVGDLAPLVANSGLGDGEDFIDLSDNCLSLGAGSQNSQDLDTLEARNPARENVVADGQGGAQCPDDGGGDEGGGGDDGGLVCTNPVPISDEGLDAGLRDALNKSSGSLSCADLESLTSFEPGDRRIVDLEGLQFAVNLQTLDLSDNPIRDISPLANLSTLQSFTFERTQVNDISPLANLTSLETLLLKENVITNVDALMGLVNLQTVDLSTNLITDLSPLVDNPGLGDGDDLVEVYHNCFADFNSPATRDIETLEARNPARDNVGALQDRVPFFMQYCPTPGQLAELAGGALTLVNMPVDTVAGTSLRPRVRGAAGLSETDGTLTLEAMKRVVEIEAVLITKSERFPLSLEGLQYAVNLEVLDLSQNSLVSLRPLAGLPKLKRLVLDLASAGDGNSSSVLGTLGNLEVLSLELGAPEDIGFLSNLIRLRDLNLEFNDLTSGDIAVLADLAHLERLILANNRIDDVSPLANLENLTTLSLMFNQISDLSPLVMNEGLGEGDDLITLGANCLDLSAGSQASENVATIEARNPQQSNVVLDEGQGGALCP